MMSCINKPLLSKLSFLLFGLLLFSGCSLTPLHQPMGSELSYKIEKLSKMVEELNISVSKNEAEDLAKTAVLKAHRLAKEYEIVSPPLWHNTLINLGIKKRGLCYQWAEDLLKTLHAKHYKTLSLHYVGASIDSYFEHNALAVSAKGQSWDRGILLDAWRDSGNLFFVKIKEDKKYEWSPRDEIYKMMFPHPKR